VNRDDVQQRIETLTVAITVRSIPRIVGSLLRTKLTIQQLKILTSLVVADGLTVSALARDFDVSVATMSKLVDRLALQGLVERRTVEGDQRSRALRPTDLGRSVVGELLGARPELGDDVLAGLSLAELQALEVGMRAINRELQHLDRR